MTAKQRTLKAKIDDKLDQALQDSFPASDPVSFLQPAPAKSGDRKLPVVEAANEMTHIEPEDHVPEVREPAGYRHSDADIARELRERLADDVGLDSGGIEVEVKNGEVMLSGPVRHCADMKRAEAHACAVQGVVLVRNGLQPKEPAPAAEPEQPAGAAAKMGKPGYER